MIPQIYQIKLIRVKIASSFSFDFEINVLSKFFFPELVVHSGDTAQITVSSIQKQLILRSLRL